MAGQSLEMRSGRLGRLRWWLMLSYIVSWSVWQLVTLDPVHNALPGVRDLPIHTLELAGAGVWAIVVIALLAVLLRIRFDAAICGILNDELARANGKRALSLGYIVVLIALLPAGYAILEKLIDPETILQELVMAALVIPMAYYLWLERDVAR